MGRHAKLLVLFLCLSLGPSCAGTANREIKPTFIKDSFIFVQKSVLFHACHTVKSKDPKQQEADQEKCVDLNRRATGSGWIAANVKRPDGQWDSIGVSAGHVCDVSKVVLRNVETGENIEAKVKEKEIRVSMLGGHTYRAEVVKIYDYIDVCILRIEGVKLPYLKTAKEAPKYGDRVFNVAAPRGIYSSSLAPFFEGHYIGRNTINHAKYGGLMDHYSLPATFGSSGSPIVNSEGEVVGLVSMAMVGFENMGISPPYESLRDILLSIQEQ